MPDGTEKKLNLDADHLEDLLDPGGRGRGGDGIRARKVTILGRTDMIANVKLEAAWGIDYIHLTKYSGESLRRPPHCDQYDRRAVQPAGPRLRE